MPTSTTFQASTRVAATLAILAAIVVGDLLAGSDHLATPALAADCFKPEITSLSGALSIVPGLSADYAVDVLNPNPAAPPPPPSLAAPAADSAPSQGEPPVNAAPPPPPPIVEAAPPVGAPAVEAAPPVGAPAVDAAPSQGAPAADAAPPPVRKPASAPAAGPAETVGAIPVARVGDNTVMVATLQHLLRYHGAHVEVDAEFGPGTEAAVRELQRLYGLPVDGVVGQQTWTALFVPVHLGDENEAVSAVQHRLGYDGFLEGDVVWGTFDAPTDAAVRAYQQANGLPVNGVVGPATWAKLVEHV